MENSLCICIKINIVKIIILAKPIYIVNVIPIKMNSNGIFLKNRKHNPKIYIESQKTRNSQCNCKKEKRWRPHTS